jgi:hypothetical protein
MEDLMAIEKRGKFVGVNTKHTNFSFFLPWPQCSYATLLNLTIKKSL